MTQQALKPIEPNTGPVHLEHFGNTDKTACGLPEWVSCDPECDNCSHRENRLTDFIPYAYLQVVHGCVHQAVRTG